jgi:hypothetical protein
VLLINNPTNNDIRQYRQLLLDGVEVNTEFVQHYADGFKSATEQGGALYYHQANFLAASLEYENSVSLEMQETTKTCSDPNYLKHKQLLYLVNKGIDDDLTIQLASHLTTNKSVKSINLSDNKISDEGFIRLMEMLKTNTTIEVLNLGNNQISDKGALALAELLKNNTTLKVVNLRSNNITTHGIIAISEALDQNHTLTSLYLEGNEGALDVVAMNKIGDSIKQNKVLEATRKPSALKPVEAINLCRDRSESNSSGGSGNTVFL